MNFFENSLLAIDTRAEQENILVLNGRHQQQPEEIKILLILNHKQLKKSLNMM